MLKGRIKARVSQEYQYAINQYNDALNKVSTDVSLAATLFKFTIHEHLSSLHGLILQPTPALTHLNRYREIAYQLRNDYFIASAELMLGRYYNRVSEQAKSLQHYTEAFRVSSRTRYSGLKAMAQLNLARTYRDLDQWDEALKHAHDAAISFQELGRGPYVSEAFVVIAMTYAAQEKWNKAIDHYLNAQQINEDLGNELAQALANHNIAEAYYNLNNPSAALTYINMANEIFRAKNVKHYLVANESLYAQILIKQQMWPQAIEHANQSLAIAREKGLIEQELESLKHLSTAYRNSGELNLALDVIDNIIALTQAQEKQKHETNSDNNTELTEQKLKFELGLQQAKLSQKLMIISKSNLLSFC
ncbi:tetratricopeptide repeat protein [Shewanella aestuarii]|uniref:Tetratricopeptide repeat protein n=1 Tax=Shewanella aestuarii TaxID=1028752 RepID=A0A6G9QJK1_9GAMM|nr:tetratricopeptide repeat protein [Shewanella aestuarii]QIR14041.1 tetratricopeptide repeat protein [Shewanella aestuarii]